MIVERAGKANRPCGRFSRRFAARSAPARPASNRPAPFLSPPQLKDDRIVAADGAVLPLRRWMPDRPPRAVILALHGFNDYSRAFERPGEYWTKMRIATYAYDQRGFGEAPRRGIWAGHETMAADAAAALDLVRARHPGVPAYVLGESMGGAIAMIAAPTLQADGLVLVAPALRGRRQLGPLASAALWLTAPDDPLVSANLRRAERSGIRQRQDAARARPRPADHQADPDRRRRGVGERNGRGARRRAAIAVADPLRRAGRTCPSGSRARPVPPNARPGSSFTGTAGTCCCAT